MTERPPTPHDPWLSLHDPGLKDAVDAGDWPRVRASLETFDEARLDTAIGCIQDVECEEWLEKVLADDPTDHVAKTLLGARYVTIGWTVRTGHRAADVSAEQFRQFHEWLTRAEELLTEVCAQRPDYVQAWTMRQPVAMGLSLGLEEARRRYDKVAALSPHHASAQSNYLQQIVPKWGGSWESAEAFATECRDAAPMGSPSRALELDVMIERWLDDSSYKAKIDLDRLRQIAEETVDHPDHRPGIWGAAVHSQLALLYCLAGKAPLAKPHFLALDGFPSRTGWRYLADDSYASFYRFAMGGDSPERVLAIGRLVFLIPGLLLLAVLGLGAVAMAILYGADGTLAEVGGALVVALVCGLLGWRTGRSVRNAWREL
ncbi:hypothetical protein WBG06_09975 [Nocardioides sp. CCNWLW239]|uniref:hypothetical protein n=1 Tax=Nocardioides sp. CCNWLW239 TaxID=3128902 RepID=UPI003016854E